jgi:hypothetical protein
MLWNLLIISHVISDRMLKILLCRQIFSLNMAEKFSWKLAAHHCWFGLAKPLHLLGPESCLTLLNMDVCVRIVVIPMPENRTT